MAQISQKTGIKHSVRVDKENIISIACCYLGLALTVLYLDLILDTGDRVIFRDIQHNQLARKRLDGDGAVVDVVEMHA